MVSAKQAWARETVATWEVMAPSDLMSRRS